MIDQKVIVHIGCMRCASTYLQACFATNDDLIDLIKTRFFSYDSYYIQGIDFINKCIQDKARQTIVQNRVYRKVGYGSRQNPLHNRPKA